MSHKREKVQLVGYETSKVRLDLIFLKPLQFHAWFTVTFDLQ